MIGLQETGPEPASKQVSGPDTTAKAMRTDDITAAVWRRCPQRGEYLLAMLALAAEADEAGVCHMTVAELAYRLRCRRRKASEVLSGLVLRSEIQRVGPNAYRMAAYRNGARS